ncbi:hypothetical protein AV530_010762 [Patagioenas fasciata monilis]|uniref:Uncharacterized protein n=1 Tax=Patagioenas fasciata monilis TaxID=372326 RepID=A0A1V4K7P1_PATFA|nr:hypothetical protein AV530_010762 [Patagioenas fasciata monilis]
MRHGMAGIAAISLLPGRRSQNAWKKSLASRMGDRGNILMVFQEASVFYLRRKPDQSEDRLPRTQSIWLSSANKLFAMCLLSKKTHCPQVTILKKTLSTCFIN